MLPDLPEVFLYLLCNQLSYEDVLVLRSTCKRLKEFVDRKQFTKLNLFMRNTPYPRKLFYTGELVGYPNSFRVDWGCLGIFTNDRFRAQFSNVQKIAIFSEKVYESVPDSDWIDFDLTNLNCFKALRHLEIDNFRQSMLFGELNLPELRIATFGNSVGLKLQCPKLRALKFCSYCLELSSDTDQLEYLDYDYQYQYNTYIVKRISPNLQRLSTICLQTIDCLLQFLSDLKTSTLCLPSLSRIRVGDLGYWGGFERLDELIDRLEDLKRDSRTKHIEFIFLGDPIRSPGELRKIANLIGTYDSEFHEIDKFGGVTDCSLPFLNRDPKLKFLFPAVGRGSPFKEDTELSPERIEELRELRTMSLRKEYEGQLSPSTIELYVSICKSLSRMFLYNQTLTERVLEKMSDLMNLQLMWIFDCQVETLKPLAKCPNLGYVNTDIVPSSDELSLLFKNCRTLECINVDPKNKIFEVRVLRTMAPKRHRVILAGVRDFQFDALQPALDFYSEKFLPNIEHLQASGKAEDENNYYALLDALKKDYENQYNIPSRSAKNSLRPPFQLVKRS